MALTDLPDDALDVALSMIDVRCWGTKFRILSLLRVLQRRSPHGWAVIGYREVAERIGNEERYVSGLLREMWKVDRVLVRGRVGTGTRGTEWRLNPYTDEWRNVPWRERRREVRALRAAAALREPDRGANDALAPGSHVAAQAPVAPRSHVAALDGLEPRSGSRRRGAGTAAPKDRGANGFEPAPSSSLPVDADASPHHDDDDELSSFAQTALRAIENKTGGLLWGRPKRKLLAWEGQVPIDFLVRAIMAAPGKLEPHQLVDRWLVDVVRTGEVRSVGSAPAGPTVADLLARSRDGCAECDKGWLYDERDDPYPCPACSAPPRSPTPMAE